MAGRQRVIGLVASVMLILLGGLLPAAALAASVTARHGPATMVFEPNQGQAEAAVRFLARGRGYGLFLTPTEAVLVLAPATRGPFRSASAALTEPLVVRMRLLGADAGATIAGAEPLSGRSHYLLGQADGWQRAVPAFERVRYTDVYPGISLVFYGTERQLEYDFIVAPGANPDDVALVFEGVDRLQVDSAGDLVLATGAGDLRLRRPVIYQEVDGERRPVDGGYVVDGHRVRFRLAAWDPARPLVIDPILAYSTFLGGSSTDQGLGITVDASGNAYVTGSTISSNFPVSSPFQAARRGVTDAFVTKLDSTGSLVFSTFLGGSGDDAGNAIAVDGSGNVLVAGTTTSGNFPVQGAAPFAPFQATLRGGNDAFVAKLAPTGGSLVYSTYLGSNTDDFGTGIAVDVLGNAYVTGSTQSASFPNNGAVTCLGTKSTGDDAFVAKLDPSGVMADGLGTPTGYCRFLGGPGVDSGEGIVADASGNVWVVGSTTSTDIGIAGAAQGSPVQATAGGQTDGFIGKLGPTGALVYLTFLGGSGDDFALGVAVDAAGNAYVTGSTDSPDFPTQLPLQQFIAGADDAFVAKVNPAGSALVFSTYLGGTADDVGNAIGVHLGDSSVYVAGSTKSVDFPTVAPIQPGLGGRLDAFVTRLNPAGGTLLFSTYLGGAGDDVAQAIAVDQGLVYITGSTNSATFPTAAPIQGPAGLLDAFVTQIAEGGTVQFTASNYQVSETAGSVTITVQRVGDTTPTTTVQFATSDGTATAGSDYTAASGTLTFSPGQIIATFTVPILNTGGCDGDETVNLTLSNASGSVLGTRSSAVLTILDPVACIAFGAAEYSVDENHGPAVITVTRSGSATGVATVRIQTFNGTATAPADYTAIDRTLTFSPGVRSLSVPITIVNDALAEGPETVTLTLSSPVGAALATERTTVTLTIVDDDIASIQFSASTYTVAEATATATITVVRSGALGTPVTVDFATSDGSATAGADYTAVTQTLTFAAGVASRTVMVPIANDTDDEANETVLLQLTNPGPGAVLGPRATATLTIADNDVAGTVQFSQSLYTVPETALTAPIAIVRSGGGAVVSVQFDTSNGPGASGALAGVDYTTTSTPVVFGPGQVTQSVAIPLAGPNAAVGSRFVALTLTAPGGGAVLGPRSTAQLKIVDDEAAVQFASPTYSVLEGGTIAITVERTGPATGTVIVPFTTGGGTAAAGVDYVTATGSLTFAATVKTLTFPVRTLANTVVDGSRTVGLTLGPGVTGTAGAVLGAQSTATLTITDNDVGGQIQFSAPTYTVSEATAGATITVVRTGGAAGPVTVDFATVGGGTATAGTDYTAVTQTLTFAAGVMSRTATVPITNDTLDEANETVFLQLTNATGGATLGPQSTATLTIVDNDVAGTVQFSQSLYTVTETAVSAPIAIVRTGGAASGVTVEFDTSDGPGASGAVAGTDYTTTSSLVTFAASVASQAVSIPMLGNPAATGSRFVTLTLSAAGGGAVLGPRSTAQLKIVDDEAAVQFASPTYAVIEGGTLAITVERTGPATGTVIVPFTTGGGTAVAGVDYVTAAGSLTFAATVKTLTFPVRTLANAAVDGSRTVGLTLGPAVTGTAGAGLGSQSTATLTITDNDVGGQIQFSAATYTVSEATALATITLVRSGGAAGPVTVDFATTVGGTATAGADYTAVAPTTITFAAGVTSRTVTVPITNDTLDEPNETVVLELTNPGGGATLGPRNTATLTILDNDVGGVVQFSAVLFTKTECAALPCDVVLTVTRTGGSASDVTVDFTTVDGTATAAANYVTTSGTLTFLAGETSQLITVPLQIEPGAEATKSFTVVISNATGGATLGVRTTAEVRIADPI
jgi:hypothetical protein